ncbi:hypothetical protein PCANC_10885 [Puccinia coronata f. sp. avenae]|uniref:Uncharacterized protein n=1 Tax=Puccinia coronata f. sp. avenae TaxID=200324 RepID=A0A2N5SWR8_9BASI|nr:hypothetical protein PCANC_10885 [Puccinia coronata f. sp. avenae]
MSAPRDLDLVAHATLYLANDITVPYYPDQEPKTDWMAMKLEAVEDFLREQEVYSPLIRHTQPNPEPAAASLTSKGKECARSPAVKTEPADDHGLLPATLMRPRLANAEGSAAAMQPLPASSDMRMIVDQDDSSWQTEQVAVPMPVSDCAPFVNLATRAKHFPVVPPPNYLSLTPSEIDRLLHDSCPFQYRFVYTPSHIRGLAYDVLAELILFMLFYEPASAQEASARVYLYRAIQSHFNRRL